MGISRRRFLQSTILTAFAAPAVARPRGISSNGLTPNGGKSQVNFQQIGVGGYEFVNLFKTSQGWGFVDPSLYKFDPNGYPTDMSLGVDVTSLFEIPPNTERSWATTGGGTIGAITVTWDGGGTISVSGLTLISGSLTSAPASVGNTATFTPTTTRPVVGIHAITSSVDYIHNIKAYFTADQSLINAGQIFSTKFLSRLQTAKFGALRFLNWGSSTGDGMNDTNMTTWSSRKPQTYYTWGGPEIRYTWFAGTTTNSGDAYSITPVASYAPGSAFPVDKQTFHIKWNATASGQSPTLAWNGGTPKLIVRPAGIPQFVGGATGRPGANQVHTVVYDAGLDAFLDFGTSTTFEFLENGVPPEIMVALCAAVGAHPDIPMPFLACDPPTDFLAGFIGLCQSYSWMIPRFEGVNECWNNGSVFFGTTYANQRQLVRNGAVTTNGVVTNPTFNATAVSNTPGVSCTITIGTHPFQVGMNLALGGTYSGLFSQPTNGIVTGITATTVTLNASFTGGTWTSGGNLSALNGDTHNWYGRAISKLGQIVAGAYGVSQGQVATQTKYQFCCGVQTNSGNTTGIPTSGTNASDARLTSAAYVIETGVANNAASKWTTHVRMANYIAPNSYLTTAGTNNESALATAFNGVQFTASATAGAMTVASIQTAGGTLAVGMTLFGANIGGFLSGAVTITGGSAPNWTLSSPITFASQSVYACSDTTAPGKYIDGLNNPASFNGQVSSNILTVNSITSGQTIFAGMTLGYSGGSLNSNITTYGTGGTTGIGGTGTYQLDRALGTIAAQAMTADGYNFGILATNNLLPTLAANWKTWASANGVNKLNCYEGGFSPDYTGNGTTPVDILRYAAKQVTSSPLSANGIQGYLTANYAIITALTVGGFVGELPSCYQLNGRYPSTVDWSVLEDIWQSPDPPQWSAIVAFNH